MSAHNQALGRSGEQRVARWYQEQGYEVVERNWRCSEGEVDLILTTGHIIVFCEVKTRSSLAFGHPAEAVGPAKQRRLRHLAARWFRENPSRSGQPRFDVAAVLPGSVEVIEGAF